jgi:steroid delta-isomerase-like uncharacterized protein
MLRLTLKCALLVVCLGLTMAGQKKPPQPPPPQQKQRGPSQTSQTADTEKNKATARRVFAELWSQGRADLVDSLYERNAVVHWANRDFRLEEMVSQGKELRAAFPDLAVHADRVTGNGETVEAAWSARGTNRGQGRGFPGKGKPAKTHGMSKFRFNSDGKIAEVWVEWDENDVRRQVAGK